MTTETSPAGGGQDRLRLAGWSLAIAATGTPATVAVLLIGDGAESTAGASVIGTITLAALAAARAFGRAGDEGERDAGGRRARPRAAVKAVRARGGTPTGRDGG